MSSLNNGHDHDASVATACASTAASDASSSPDAGMAKTGRTYWRSLDDLADTPEFREFMHREFPAGASELLDSGDRRHFLKIMGASMALAGATLSGCRRWPVEQIRPFATRPENRTPGVPVQYATSMELAGVSHGLLATSSDGRPIKIEGNPEHPINQGGTDALMQATVLDLYDPDRSRLVLRNGERADWQDFVRWSNNRLSERGGQGLAILSEATRSPSVQSMRRRLMERYRDAAWHEYEPLNNDNEHNGSVLALGSPHRTHYHFDKAKVIVSLDADFLLNHPAMVKHNRDFASTRRAMDDPKTMSRLYMVESGFSMTGANADERMAMRSSDIAMFAAALAGELVTGMSNLPRGEGVVPAEMLQRVVADLRANRGASIVVAGANQPAEVHALAHAINNALDNVDSTVTYTTMPDQVAHGESLRELVDAMQAGRVHTLVIIGGNPAYNAPADLEFAARIAEMKEHGGAVVHLSDYVDETSALCDWHLNRAHYLESWGDGRAYDGAICLTQPIIEPLFHGRTPIELLAVLAGDDLRSGYDLVRRTFSEETNTDNHDAPNSLWHRSLHNGLLVGSGPGSANPRVQAGQIQSRAVAMLQNRQTPGAGEVELNFVADPCVYDGRFANNGWLQELPHVMTKLTWDNALLVNPALARELGVKDGDLVTVTVNGSTLTLPVLQLPGHHKNSASISLGYGRQFNGRIASGCGFDAYTLRHSDTMYVASARIEKAGGTYVLATTQDHHAVDSVAGRGVQDRLPSLLREATLKEYEAKPNFVRYQKNLHVMHRLSLWEENFPFHRATGYEEARFAWAMSIDLSACTGCNACVVACQAENNIPIVGKDQVNRHREMHWLRVDRYFRVDDPNRSDAESRPDAVGFMPVPCMQCENAPCEQVCPVAATVHDEEGLNVMVYNRCIGTRYCSNNCPYKVRRFNYFDYHRREPLRETGPVHVQGDYWTKPQAAADPIQQMQFNPEVTVRSRGVMEKCTYCTQRITTGRIRAKNRWLQLTEEQKRASNGPVVEDGEITPACAQACPAQAIVFGDLKDPNSRVSKLHAHERTYEMLEELNTKPRTRYMGKLRNPNEGSQA
jgi:MoCo/4Fe-4S cofactor protein with predicted Tat translocation signal